MWPNAARAWISFSWRRFARRRRRAPWRPGSARAVLRAPRPRQLRASRRDCRRSEDCHPPVSCRSTSSQVRIGRDERPGLPPGVGLTSKGLLFTLGTLGPGGRQGQLKVETLLLPISASGKVGKKTAAEHVQVVKRVPSGTSSDQLGLRPETFEPGIYRLDLVFRDGGGEAPWPATRCTSRSRTRAAKSQLAVNGTSFAPAETVFVQVRNPGTDVVYYDDSYALERFDGSCLGGGPSRSRRSGSA